MQLCSCALIQQDEGQFYDRKSLWEGPPGSKRRRDKRIVRDQIVNTDYQQLNQVDRDVA